LRLTLRIVISQYCVVAARCVTVKLNTARLLYCHGMIEVQWSAVDRTDTCLMASFSGQPA